MMDTCATVSINALTGTLSKVTSKRFRVVGNVKRGSLAEVVVNAAPSPEAALPSFPVGGAANRSGKQDGVVGTNEIDGEQGMVSGRSEVSSEVRQDQGMWSA